MPRKRYETSDDRRNENAARDFVENLAGDRVTIHKLPRRYFLDWYFELDKRECIEVAEYKRRNVTWQGKGKELMIALDKIAHGIELSDYVKAPFYLYIDFTNGLRKTRIVDVKPSQVRWGGRMWSARDSEDQEPCIFIPQEEFEEVV